MKLLNKIMGVILFVLIILLTIDGFFTFRREHELFDIDMERDALLLGHALRSLVTITWQNSGEDKALELIERVNRDESRIQIRWVWFDSAPGGKFAPRVSREELGDLYERGELSIKKSGGPAGGYRYSYLLCHVDGSRAGGLELSESLSELNNYTRGTVVRSIILAVLMVLSSWGMLWILGVRYVGRPLDSLVGKARRVGTGDFSGDIVLEGGNELSQLASAMNEMCGQLAAARERVRSETEARIKALEQLRHSERLAVLGRISSGIAHELGTPLNVVAGRAKLISTEDLEHEEIVASSRIIEEQAQRMTGILHQLLDYARRRPSKRSPVHIAHLIRQVVDLITPTARKTGVTLAFEERREVPPVNADQSQMQQVFMNLIMNAIQAMPDGGTVFLDVDVEEASHPGAENGEKKMSLVVHVRDQGEGIPEENIHFIFDPFFTTKEVGKGTGLGLSVTQGIVQDHGGWIRVTSEPGIGSCFSVYLPIEESE